MRGERFGRVRITWESKLADGPAERGHASLSVGFLPSRSLPGPTNLAGMAKPLRIIYALTFQLEGGLSATLPLNRSGQAAPSRANDAKNGMPHWPKKRTIDLRVGDQVFFRGCWRTIQGIRAARDAWLTAEEARAVGDAGYVYRPRKPR